MGAHGYLTAVTCFGRSGLRAQQFSPLRPTAVLEPGNVASDSNILRWDKWVIFL